MNIHIIFIIIVLLSSMFGQSQDRRLICLQGRVDRLVELSGEVFFEAPPEYQIINSNLGGIGGNKNSFEQIEYHFTGFPILVRYRGHGQFFLMDQNKSISHYFYKKYKGIGRLQEGYYLASSIDDQGMLQETKYEFLDRFGTPIFIANQGYRDASYFSEGLAPIKVWGKGWVYINDLGHELDLIPDSLGHMEWVHPFKNGRSLIKKVAYKQNSRSIEPYYISKKGEILLDVKSLFPGREISNISDYKGGVAYVQFEFLNDGEYKGMPVVFIDSIGKIILDIDAAIDFKVDGNGFITFQKKLGDQKYTSEIYDKSGRKLNLPENVNHIKYLGENKYLIGCDIPFGKPNGKARYYIFDAQSEKIIQPHSGGECLGVIDNKLIIKGANEVIVISELGTEKVIYQSQLTDMKVKDLESYKGKLEDISIFYCQKAEWLHRIKDMKNLKELTLSNLNITQLPEIANPGLLKLLRIDGCRNLKYLDIQINNVKQLSLRGCLSLTNVLEYVNNQKSLIHLFIINMDVSSSVTSEIINSYPKAVIRGNAEAADYELQEVIFGF